MGKIQAVIGANFGDEGKGRTVNWLAGESAAPLVIRHNSGAQAGHTVIHDGKRHVFSHFGSATLQGVSTLLCHRFVVNPILFNQEYDQLVALGVTPIVYVDSNCAMSTPLDMMLNQMRELSRDDRHGSVGVGFGETIDRGLRGPTLHFRHRRRDIMQSVLGQWFLDEQSWLLAKMCRWPLDLQRVRAALWAGEFRWDIYWKQYELMQERIRYVHNVGDFLKARAKKCDFIFEGAQGLALHQDRGLGAPDHATWSRTGMEDIVEFLDKYEVEGKVAPFYVSRTYLTRHGNGPLPGEEPMPDWVVDPTNVPNEWQGSLRFALFSGIFTLQNIAKDMESVPTDRRTDETCVLTCADQVDELTDTMTRGFADLIFHSPCNEAPELSQYQGK